MIIDREKQYLVLEGHKLSREMIIATDVDSVAISLRDLFVFLHRWFDSSDQMVVHTSGSTGTPKELKVSKDCMMQSALLTCNFLGLKAGDTAFLCMNLRYIGAMMVVVRSLVFSLDLTVRPASGNPLSSVVTPFDFAAMVPLQVFNSLGDPIERERLKHIRLLIIGGGAIDNRLLEQLSSFPNAIYSTYGMTETLSHIALRRLNGSEATTRYIPFDHIRLSTAADDTLIIDAPTICKAVLHTNDVVRLYEDGSFEVLGRKDNVINSGGIKIQIEQDEELLKSVITHPFAITSIPDERLGEAVVLLVERINDNEYTGLQNRMKAILPQFHCPKYICSVDRLPMAGNGKIDRKACLRMAYEQFK